MANYKGGYIDPIFSCWATPLGEAYTSWLYADKQSNPYYDQPAEWAGAGQVVFADRSLNFTGLANNNTQTLPLNLGGGKNVLVFSRVCAVFPKTAGTPNTVVLPNQIHSYVSVQEERQDGLIEIETTPISNTFGFGWSPHVLPFPEKWQGNQQRSLTVTNTSGVEVNVRFSWKIAYLNTGR
jgi:hypothetical protein